MRVCQDMLCCRPEDLNRAMAIHTRKITDSCRDKDCIEDLRVYLTRDSQSALDSAAGVKVRCAELLYASVEVSPITFHRNHYCVDLTFYYRILADTVSCACRPAPLTGLALFSKRAVLCGESTGIHIFSSDDNGNCVCSDPLPTAVAEVLDPIVLSSRVVSGCAQEPCPLQIPVCVQERFDSELVLGGDQQLLVTLGQFSIIRLERPTQIIIPVLDYAIPTKECRCDPGAAEDPCEVFSRIPFPADAFTPAGCTEDQESCES